jgi:phospholipid/cholesterol/gamma-HCH transport system permease protein
MTTVSAHITEAAAPARARRLTRLRTSILGVGDMVDLSGQIARGIPRCIRDYMVETLRQATILGHGSAPIVLLLVFGSGLSLGVGSVYGARLIGAPSVAALGPVLAGLRELFPYAFAYMMAAKVSTGYVAEIGTMRITEEIDALDVMGVDSLVYLGSTRVLATWLVLPLMFAMAIVVGFAASYLTAVIQLHQTSPGGYLRLFWEFQNPSDYLYSVIKGIVMGSYVVLVGLFFGYRVRGGPAEVGVATARAMIVNLVGIHVIGMIMSEAFWGFNANLPVGG